ncbi:transporter [Penicillium taxi]|uniref:transporter n=1 Tax=Penicillium taxi TaxID=168475 RepID=UPI002545B88A|nr:transporter [Penicillium taxi]KAJ5887875.1 transporter [Penicillium taxi]
MAIGLGGVFATQFVGISAVAPENQSSTTITVYYMAQQLGMIGGTTLAATISRAQLRRGLLRKLGTSAEALAIIQKVLGDTRFAQSLPDHSQGIIRSIYLESFRAVPIISLIAELLALPLLSCLKERLLT